MKHSDAKEFGIKGNPKFIRAHYFLLMNENDSGQRSVIKDVVKTQFIVEYYYNKNGNLDSITTYPFLTPEKKEKTIYYNQINPRKGCTFDYKNQLVDSLSFMWISDTAYCIIRTNKHGEVTRKNIFYLNQQYRDLHSTMIEYDHLHEIIFEQTYFNTINTDGLITHTWTKTKSRPDTVRSICVYNEFDREGNPLEAKVIDEKSKETIENIYREISYY